VGEICRRLDGIPLAIELAAARVIAMSPSEIASLLDERFRLLAGGRRMSLARHQTMRATVEWSYGLLTETERLVFDRLSVFTGFSATSAQEVVADDRLDRWTILESVDALVLKSMIITDEKADGATWYVMLETLRQFASERLDERNEVDDRRRRHALYYAEFAETIGPALLGADELVWRALLYDNLDNLRSAMEWSLAAGEEAELLAVRIMAALTEDHGLSARTTLGLVDPTRTVPAARRASAGIRAAVLAAASFEMTLRGDMAAARTYADEALATGVPADCPATYRVYFCGTDNTWMARTGSELRLLREAYRDLEVRNLTVAERARFAGMVVMHYTNANLLEEAKPYAADAHDLALASANPSTIAQAMYHVGSYHARDDPEAALAAFTESLEVARRGTTDSVISPSHYQRALLWAHAGDRGAALRDLRAGITVASELAQTPQLLGAFGYAIEIFTALGHHEPAAVLIGAARSGALSPLREMTPPPDRRQRGSSPIRAALGDDHFASLQGLGAAMSRDELEAWVLSTIDQLLEGTPTPAPD
jgi:tetratricopeptide (TPR) repeat protein